MEDKEHSRKNGQQKGQEKYNLDTLRVHSDKNIENSGKAGNAYLKSKFQIKKLEFLGNKDNL